MTKYIETQLALFISKNLLCGNNKSFRIVISINRHGSHYIHFDNNLYLIDTMMMYGSLRNYLKPENQNSVLG